LKTMSVVLKHSIGASPMEKIEQFEMDWWVLSHCQILVVEPTSGKIHTEERICEDWAESAYCEIF
jgi:hypothetical protein